MRRHDGAERAEGGRDRRKRNSRVNKQPEGRMCGDTHTRTRARACGRVCVAPVRWTSQRPVRSARYMSSQKIARCSCSVFLHSCLGPNVSGDCMGWGGVGGKWGGPLGRTGVPYTCQAPHSRAGKSSAAASAWPPSAQASRTALPTCPSSFSTLLSDATPCPAVRRSYSLIPSDGTTRRRRLAAGGAAAAAAAISVT